MLFAVQLAVEEVRTGDLPDNFLLFAIGLHDIGLFVFEGGMDRARVALLRSEPEREAGSEAAVLSA